MKASVALGASLVVNGVLALAAGIFYFDNADHSVREKKLEADVRTYAGKFLDLQQRVDEDEHESKNALEFLRYQLEQCEAKVKK
jgi:hypothetical protein